MSGFTSISRRRFLGAAAGGLLLPAAGLSRADDGRTSAGQGAETAGSAAKPQSFRFVHFTDSHVQPELNAAKGFAKALEAAQALDPAPDFILTGGDLVMDVLEEREKRSTMLFELYKKLLLDHCGLPVHQCIGNHDVFGWGKPFGVTPKHPRYGKEMVVEELELPGRYYRFDHKGWRFYVLDSIQPAEKTTYQGYIDAEQLAWLKQELAAKDPAMPAVAVTHIPLLSASAISWCMAHGEGKLAPNIICRGGGAVGRLLGDHGVRLALSGHIHQLDRIEYRGLTYICDGAVAAKWWKGPNDGLQEGFGVIDLAADGTVSHTYHDYGWQAG